MARFILFLSGFLFLVSCAEIVPLTGGTQDEVAAQPVPGTQNPPQGALNVNQQQLTVRFDEYFTLNDPSNTVVMNPNAGKLTVSSKKKDLVIQWDGELQPNTTYIIQMNGTVRDLNEKNDTIHQFVFSTGNQIDSLAFNGVVLDAFTNKAGANYVVGLYTNQKDPFKDLPDYVSQSNAKGEFEFSYLKPGFYRLFAFFDQNKDRKPGKSERIAFSSELIQTGDTIPFELRAYVPKDTVQKMQFKPVSPGLGIVSGRKVNEAQLLVNGKVADVLQRIEEDSLIVALPQPSNGYITLIYEQDTILKQLSEKERNARFPILNQVYKNSWTFGDTLVFTVNEKIQGLDVSAITILDKQQQPVSFKSFYEGTTIQLYPEENTTYDLNVFFQQGAIKGAMNASDSLRLELKNLKLTDLSNLKLDVSQMEGRWIIQLMEGQKVVRSAVKREQDHFVLFDRLIPLTYHIQCVEDLNGNGKWDGGLWSEKKQPERVVRFELKNKLRPNWDIEEVLKLD